MRLKMCRRAATAMPSKTSIFLPSIKCTYVGQPVAAVAAVDEDTAEEALSLIEVEYEELPAVFDAEEAIRDGAPLVHDDFDQLEGALGLLGFMVSGAGHQHHPSGLQRARQCRSGTAESRLCL